MRHGTVTIGIPGGVRVPVGSAVFKTVARSPGAVVGGFDSHTPLPRIHKGSWQPYGDITVELQNGVMVELDPF